MWLLSVVPSLALIFSHNMVSSLTSVMAVSFAFLALAVRYSLPCQRSPLPLLCCQRLHCPRANALLDEFPSVLVSH